MTVANMCFFRARRAFYDVNEIGWCARPKDTSMIAVETEERGKWGFFKRNKKIKNPDGFVRKGQFKKASNMNYCLDFSIRVEDEFLRLMAVRAESKGCDVEALTLEDEKELNDEAMKTIIESDEGRTLAAGNVRIGEVILLIDSDTRVVSLFPDARMFLHRPSLLFYVELLLSSRQLLTI